MSNEPKRYDFFYNHNFACVDKVESPQGDYVHYDDYARLKAEIERLTKAGDAMARFINRETWWKIGGRNDSPNVSKWNAAKEGKQS